jgi:membrane protease YdiL (CAAX protease family)
MLTLSKREFRIVWGFLVAATVSEVIAVAFMFQPKGSWIDSLLKYCINPPGTARAWTLATVITAAYVGYSAWRSPVIRHYAFDPASWGPFIGVRLFAIPMAFVTGFFEEAFFRKWVMDVVERQGSGVLAQIILSAVVFGAAHAIWGVFGGKYRAALAVMLVTTALGGLLAVVYLVGGRSIGPCIAAHTGLNIFLEPWLVISSATGSWGKQSVRAGLPEVSQGQPPDAVAQR